MSVLTRIPVVGALAYREQVEALPPAFEATLTVEAANRYFRHAIAVLVGGQKLGYVAPEIAPNYYGLVERGAVTCPGRRASRADHETSGVEILLDFSSLPVEAG